MKGFVEGSGEVFVVDLNDLSDENKQKFNYLYNWWAVQINYETYNGWFRDLSKLEEDTLKGIGVKINTLRLLPRLSPSLMSKYVGVGRHGDVLLDKG